MRRDDNRKSLLKKLTVTNHALILSEQVHGNSVNIVLDSDPVETKVTGADGLVSNQKGITVGVLVADCVPIFLADPKKKIVAAIHAGWKGTLGNIVVNAVSKMVTLGSTPGDIFAFIGPHIGACCYSVPKDRIDRFTTVFDKDPNVSFCHNGIWYLDIGWANRRQLLDARIKSDHIDAPVVCTSCQSDIFYSYRKDTKESFGEMLGIIGFID